MLQEKRSMNKRRNILFLIAIFVLFIIKAERAQTDAATAGVDWNNDIEETAHGVATSGLIFVALIGSVLAAIRVRATHLRQQRDEGGPQQLGLSQLSATDAERRR